MFLYMYVKNTKKNNLSLISWSSSNNNNNKTHTEHTNIHTYFLFLNFPFFEI
jgi:hypothetical protein